MAALRDTTTRLLGLRGEAQTSPPQTVPSATTRRPVDFHSSSGLLNGTGEPNRVSAQANAARAGHVIRSGRSIRLRHTFHRDLARTDGRVH